MSELTKEAERIADLVRCSPVRDDAHGVLCAMVPLDTVDEVRAVLGSLVEQLDDANAAMDWHVKTIHQYSQNAEKYKLLASCYEDVLRLILALPPERLDEVPWMVERALDETA